jgi:hemin uptake protein HemP
MDPHLPRPERPFARPARAAPDPRPVHDARALTDGGNDAEIVLDGVRYVLRITRQDKLILTK